MLTAGEVAGLIVAMFWAILVCFLAVVLVRLARLLTQTTKLMADLNERVIPLLDDVSLTVAEANRQLVAVEAIAGDMKQVSGNMVRVTGVASTFFAKPLIKASALAHGVRRAVAARRAPRPSLEGRRRA
ncbi:hypothetical protein Skr01_55170 [Sphaerisporangium krabiense]|uniref:Uncharacterized protein YoxC n=1 Tax=Sphaerisporangium krabiense TaxID=763782 RepID=A0A7W8ZBC5_9ACTN|nr:DUF948 domain-containing protein [Sphaerisporangium krabiense]MBB5630884.1 uncharacterized protein YoxC [Sphaerisporangium krabiense]GII65432.1 hypothetical protein Skr01_55170 [Sphaerisporangium krabiense]